MYKLFILAAFFALAAARPGYVEDHHLAYPAPLATTLVHEPAYAHVGSVVKSIPTAVSHQSISQVHSSAHVVQPLVAPIIKSYSAPLLKSYAPVAAVAPVIKTYASPLDHGYGVAPLLDSGYTTYSTGPILKPYGSYGHDTYGHGSYGHGVYGHGYGGAYGKYGAF